MVSVNVKRLVVSVFGLVLLCSLSETGVPAAGNFGGDCLASDACNDNTMTCNKNKKCECVAGKIFNMTTKKCEDIPAGNFGGDCLPSDVCNDNTMKCNNKKCECVAGKIFNMTTKQCEDIGAGLFGDECNAQKKCDNEFTCDNGKCGCQDKMYNSITKKCEDIPDGAFGGKCKASDVCDGELKCTSGKCICEAGKNYVKTTKQCTAPVAYGGECSDVKKCSYSMVCKNKKCECDSDKAYDSRMKLCMRCKPACSGIQVCEEHNLSGAKAECVNPPATYFADCSKDATVCKNGLQCMNKQICFCLVTAGYEIINGECKKLGPANTFKTCLRHSDCKPDLHCYGGYCLCKYGMVATTDGKCIKNTAQASLCSTNCTEDETCVEDKENKRHICLEISDTAYETCQDNQDCRNGFTCEASEKEKKACTCKHSISKGNCTTIVFNKDKPANNGEDCSNERKCKKEAGLTCATEDGQTRMKCMCHKGYFWNGESCEMQKGLGQNCDWIDPKKDMCPDFDKRCVTSFCDSGKCGCKDRSQYEEGGNCKPRKDLKTSCNANNECKGHALCISSVCACDGDKSVEKDGKCEKKPGFMEFGCDVIKCTSTLICKTDDKTKKERCVCSDTQYWNEKDGKCVDKKKDGEPCDRHGMCVSHRCQRTRRGRYCSCSDHKNKYYDVEKKECVDRIDFDQPCTAHLDMDECPDDAECTTRDQKDKKPVCKCKFNYYQDGKECKKVPVENFCRQRKPDVISLELIPGGKLEYLCPSFKFTEDLVDFEYSVDFRSGFENPDVPKQDFKNILSDNKKQNSTTRAVETLHTSAPLTTKGVGNTVSKKGTETKLSSTLLVSTPPYCGPGVLRFTFTWKEGSDTKKAVVYRPAEFDCNNSGKDIGLVVEGVDTSVEPEIDRDENDLAKVLGQLKTKDGPNVTISVQPTTKDSGLPENTLERPHHVCLWIRKRVKDYGNCTKMPLRKSSDRNLWCIPDVRAIQGKLLYDVTKFHYIPNGRILCGDVDLIIQFDSDVTDMEDDNKTCNNFIVIPAKIKCDYKTVKENVFYSYPTMGGLMNYASVQDGDEVKEFMFINGPGSWRKVTDVDRRAVSVMQVLEAYMGYFSELNHFGLTCAMAMKRTEEFFSVDYDSLLPENFRNAIRQLTSFSDEDIDIGRLVEAASGDRGLYGFLSGIMKPGKCLFKPGSDRSATRKYMHELLHGLLKEGLPTLRVLPKLPEGVTKEAVEINGQHTAALALILEQLNGGGGYHMIARYVKQIIDELKNPSNTPGCYKWHNMIVPMIENTLHCERVVDKYPKDKVEICKSIMTTYMLTISNSWGRDIRSRDGSKCRPFGSGHIGVSYPLKSFVDGNDLYAYSLDMTLYKMCGRRVGVCDCENQS